jgi:DNA-directed RNA polymerase specialized sigma24 family protein
MSTRTTWFNPSAGRFFGGFATASFDWIIWGSLWGLLTRITLCKCARAARRTQGTQKQSALDTTFGWEVIAREPSPAEAACFSDTLDCLMKPLRESHRQILTLALQGYTQEEIGRKVGYTERTVRRVLSEVEAHLERMDRRESA